MKFLITLLAACLLMVKTLPAQTDFRPGYVISTVGDTLFGEISYRGDLLMGQECKFRHSELDEAIVYFPGDISAFRFIGSKYFVSRKVDNTVAFLEFLINGEVNMYYLRDKSGDRYFLDKERISIVEIPYIKEIREKDGKSYEYESKDHVGILKYYLREAPVLQAEIIDMSKPGHQNLIKLAENYHEAVCDDGKTCIIYEKKLPILKLNLELVGRAMKYRKRGFFEYSDLGQLNKDFYGQFGIYIHFWAPRSNEKLYFKTGLSLVKLLSVNETVSYVVIPAHLEYIYPKGRIRPRASYGINFWTQSLDRVAMAPAFSGGVNILLSERFFLTVVTHIEFSPSRVAFFPKSLISNSVDLGLFVKL